LSWQKNITWLLLRETALKVPAWGGFVSLTGNLPDTLTTIGYYPVIHNPITENKTVQECLRLAEAATNEVGQEYTLVTDDLGVAMKAWPIIWNNPDRYKKVINLIGTFHLLHVCMCSFSLHREEA
jgi:hypothetical protein